MSPPLPLIRSPRCCVPMPSLPLRPVPTWCALTRSSTCTRFSNPEATASRDQRLPLLKLHSEGTDCSTAGVCNSAAGIEIRHNWRQNYTEAAAIPRSTHDAGIFVQAFGALSRVCSVDASQACSSDSDCPDGAGWCNSRAGSAIHTETRGEQIGLMVDGMASTGPAIRVDGGDLYVTGGEVQIRKAGRTHTVYGGLPLDLPPLHSWHGRQSTCRHGWSMMVLSRQRHRQTPVCGSCMRLPVVWLICPTCARALLTLGGDFNPML